MSESVHTNTSLWSKGMKAVIVAQFLSAFGDNALLFEPPRESWRLNFLRKR